MTPLYLRGSNCTNPRNGKRYSGATPFRGATRQMLDAGRSEYAATYGRLNSELHLIVSFNADPKRIAAAEDRQALWIHRQRQREQLAASKRHVADTTITGPQCHNVADVPLRVRNRSQSTKEPTMKRIKMHTQKERAIQTAVELHVGTEPEDGVEFAIKIGDDEPEDGVEFIVKSERRQAREAA